MNQTIFDFESLVATFDKPSDDDATAAIEIARALLLRARSLQTPQELRQQAELDRMIDNPGDKATLVEMTDQAFRTHSPARVADQLTHLLDLQGVPRFFSPLEQTMLRGFQTFGGYLPGVAVPMVKDKMRQETANVILPAEEQELREHLSARQDTGLVMNVNFLGEALLGEREAEQRLQHYLKSLQVPEIACISIKISTIYSQVSTIARRETIRTLSDRLELLYRAAARAQFVPPDGISVSKFVYLDMEEYRDLHLTSEAFKETLERPGLEKVRAGIALQAYVPDSFGVVDDLINWSAVRVANGGVPVTVRLVKGANMEMERVEASLGGWPQTPYDKKVHTDANFKRMLRRMIDAAAQGHIHIGVASHNLFDIALAMLWGYRTKRRAPDLKASTGSVLDQMQFEMLEGMANHQRRALCEAVPRMLLYAPACRREDFLNAIGYLIRRLDENTGVENFLRYSFRLEPDSETWKQLACGFQESLAISHNVDVTPRRKQDRREPPVQPPAADHWSVYINEPDTDWSLPQHSAWAESIVESWIQRCDTNATQIPLEIEGCVREPKQDGGDQRNARVQKESIDPSRPNRVACRYTQASDEDVRDAIDCAHRDPSGWRQTSWQARNELLRAAAQVLRERRGDLIGSAMIDAGKLVTEADPEISEAIDFTEFYPLAARDYIERFESDQSRVSIAPRGTVAVISPWNFPLAIPCGGIVAALAAGNTVILKPASDTVLPAHQIAACFWDAGVPKTVLQFVPCSGSGAGQRLVTDPRIDAVVLTGGTETAQEMLRLRPSLNLIAETGGKNATIVTALSDRDLAIKHVLHSAFSHSGQKCSATSLLLLDQEIYDDDRFRQSLADATESLAVGSAWDLTSRIGPLIRPPSGVLGQGIKELEPDEEWLVMPKPIGDNPHLYRPGIKWNVHPGSFTHRTELFGPVLGVMPFRKLEQAIEMVNATGYGLTSGLESLDDREQQLWKSNVHAGNLYINRPTTGAIVLRQPFGGIGSSGYGPGAKAGGPHYVVPMMRFENTSPSPNRNAKPLPDQVSPIHDALAALVQLSGNMADVGSDRLAQFAYDANDFATQTIRKTHDHVQLIGQDNLRSYVPVRQLRVRLSGNESISDIAVSILAAAAADCPLTYSVPPDSNDQINFLDSLTEQMLHHAKTGWRCEWTEESDAALSAEISDGRVDRLRILRPIGGLPESVLRACRVAFVTIVSEPVVDDAEIETLRYLNEKSISHDYHRYGNLGRRQSTSAKERI